MSGLSSSTKYYKEALNLLRQCSKNEDRHDLSEKVFEELSSTSSNTIKIIKSCTREIEEFLGFVKSKESLVNLFDRITSMEFEKLITDGAGSFFLEKLLVRLTKILDEEKQNEKLSSSFETFFSKIVENFADFVEANGSSHVVAAAINFLQAPILPSNENEFDSILDGGRAEKKFVEFPNFWKIEDKIRQIGKVFRKNSTKNDLILSSLLRSSAVRREKLFKKLAELFWSRFENPLTLGDFLDRNSSFLFQIFLEFDCEQRRDVVYPFVLENLEHLYLDPIGNYLLQHFFLNLQQKSIGEQVFLFFNQENRFDDLIHRAQIRLFVAFIRLCERLQINYEKLIANLQKSIGLNPEETQQFIPRLLKLRKDQSSSDVISKEGCLIVQALLRAEHVDSFTRRSFLSLSGEEISSVARQAQGSHILCQLISTPKLWTTIEKNGIYEKLGPFYIDMSCDKAACWFVGKLWKNARTIEQKLTMAESLSQHLSRVRSDVYGKFISYEMNLPSFSTRPDHWRRNLEILLKKQKLVDCFDESNEKKKKKKIG